MVERWTVYPKVARSTRVTSAFYKNERPYLSLKESDHFFIISSSFLLGTGRFLSI